MTGIHGAFQAPPREIEKSSTVYAFKPELDAWLLGRRTEPVSVVRGENEWRNGGSGAETVRPVDGIRDCPGCGYWIDRRASALDNLTGDNELMRITSR